MVATFRFLSFGCALLLAASALGQESQTQSSERERRVRILVNGLYDTMGQSFSESSTFTQYVEQGNAQRDYDGGKGFVFEGGVIIGVTKSFGVMGSVEVYHTDYDVSFEERLPHPLYFDKSRTVTGNETGFGYDEKAIHVDAVFTHATSSVTVDVFGGPSFFVTSTELLGTINTTSEYPFDEVTFTGTSKVTSDDNPIGFNAGGSVTFHLTKVFGVAVQGRYSKGTIKVSREGGQEFELDAGGFRVGAGIRLAF